MKNNTKKRIMDTATLLFASQGFKGTTMQELTSSADLSRAAIGYYFDSRAALYEAILKQHFVPAFLTLQSIEPLSAQKTACDRILLYAEAVAALKRRQPFFLPLWQGEIIHPTRYGESTVKLYTHQLYQSLLSALYDGMASGEFVAGIQPYHTASLLVEMLHSHFLIPLTVDSIPLVEDTSTGYIRIFLRGLIKHS